MIGILYVFHGSPQAQRNIESEAFSLRIHKNLSREYPMEVGYIDVHEVSVPVATRRLLDQGVRQLLVVPLLLFEGLHTNEELPQQVHATIQDYGDDVTVHITLPIGPRPGALTQLDAHLNHYAPTSYDKLLVIAHGSNYSCQPQSTIDQAVAYFDQKIHQEVQGTTLRGRHNYQEGLENFIQAQDRVLVLPYFLIDGHLYRQILPELAAKYPQADFQLAAPIGFSDYLIADVVEEIQKVKQQCTQYS